MSLSTFHPKKLFAFSLLSFADLFLTYQLLKKTGGSVYESNPIANAWLTSYGWAGLVVFKFIAMSVLVGVAVLLTMQRSRLGGDVLSFACVAVGAVVCYSCTLMSRCERSGEEPWRFGSGNGLVLRHPAHIGSRTLPDSVKGRLRQALQTGAQGRFTRVSVAGSSAKANELRKLMLHSPFELNDQGVSLAEPRGLQLRLTGSSLAENSPQTNAAPAANQGSFPGLHLELGTAGSD